MEPGSPTNGTVLKLILRRIARNLGYSIWTNWLGLLVFLFISSLILYLLSAYECPVRRALGFPLSRSQDVATAFYESPWEQDCEVKDAKP
jgi:hypothetical protein